jgi:hypothetical protein
MKERQKFLSSRFLLLCKDEFPNAIIKDSFLIQEFFITRYSNTIKVSTIVCRHSSPDTFPRLFSVTSFGESIRIRLLETEKVIEMKNLDLRLFKPETE